MIKAKIFADFIYPCPTCGGKDMRVIKTNDPLWKDHAYKMECPCGFSSPSGNNKLEDLVRSWNVAVVAHEMLKNNGQT